MFLNHCHVFPEGAFGPEKPELGTLPELDRFLRETGIERAVAFAPFWGPRTAEMLAGEEPNAWLCRRLKGYPNILGAAAVCPTAPDACALVERYVRAGFVGIKTHPPVMGFRIDDPACDDFYALAAETGTLLEVNGSDERLDLDDRRARAALDAGCRFTIDSDAHYLSEWDNVIWGTDIARRGWLEAGHVANTLPRDAFLALMAEKPHRL